MKLIVSTEIWKTQAGTVSKAVVRDTKGKFIGATNQTKGVPVSKRAVSSDFSLIGR
jgi:hypothetical protein